MTHVGTCLTAKGVKPIVSFQQAFKNTYLYGSFSPIDGDSFMWEIEGVDSSIFEAYLNEFTNHNPKQLKIIVLDNASFHSTKNIIIPDNIILINIPAYTPELNPAEKVWAYIKERFKNRVFLNMKNLKEWLYNFIKKSLNKELIQSIVYNQFYNDIFLAQFNC